uniref:Uncharacterized protein n=1 Tax=Arundo donax TaxID=35708 RepID=A0A0A9CY94_ARUDO
MCYLHIHHRGSWKQSQGTFQGGLAVVCGLIHFPEAPISTCSEYFI